MAGGRPSKYDPAVCEQVLAWGAEGKSKTWMAAKLGVNKDTLYEWERTHQAFSDALSRAMALSQMWWEDAGQSGLYIQGFNAGVYNKQMSNRFPDEHRETSNVNQTLNANVKQTVEWVVQPVKPVNEV